MKFLFNIPLILALSSTATMIAAQTETTPCYTETDFNLTVQKECNYMQVVRALKQKIRADEACTNDPKTELMAIFGMSSQADVEIEVNARCARASAIADLQTISYDQIAGEGEQFDNDFFNGGTDLNLQVQSTGPDGNPINVLKEDAAFIKDTMNGVGSSGIITFPAQYQNFDNCNLRAVNCCWISDRQANDGNGNCREPYETNCVDADPKPNTRICLNRDVNNAIIEENPKVHCHAFAWANDPMDMSARFNGNNLFYVSMFDHLYTRGYVRNIPDQPMCGCIEDMPAMIRTDCTEVRAFAKYDFSYTSASLNPMITFGSVDINYKNCMGAGGIKNDLEAYYVRLVEENKATTEELASVQDILDDECEALDLPGPPNGGGGGGGNQGGQPNGGGGNRNPNRQGGRGRNGGRRLR